ncbi:beta-lactamase (plasmid) [Ketogulonicigenium vulgare Y25]|uniref:Beta-lactamase n=1 Tax=Ketogulonicigenium vulgare (strain WSH-001) TaxID=759362 RepID=F9YBQ3_KETVW|nr:serine hydrolase [Ketogulonicigenium vulgare]ADO44370.1 beta-lactamase [Ketogulonicigenium vulgare Y25]AEM42805.1 Beta-lactamase [Ketogulonicigenium vulgare WSH-001]ALJ82764.1 serine hydrolase [Ketogulonicigenium vulgare]
MTPCTNPNGQWQSDDSAFSPAAKAAITAVADSQNTDAALVIIGGKIVYAYGDTTRKYLCHSIRKSFLAALMGQDVADGTIDLNATMKDLNIDDNDGLSDVELQAQVYDLLTARSGVYHAAGYETKWMQRIKEKRHSHAPGTFWCYNNWDFNALGTVFVQQTGLSVADAFQQRIAGPVGMEDFSLAGDTPDAWRESFQQSRHDAYPFRMSSRDLARFGQLYLQGGRWSDQQILPEGWAEECVMLYSHAGARGGYGYMFWLERDGVFAPGVKTPKGSYSANGAGGHYCMVVPEHDMVIIHRVDTETPGTELSKFGFGKFLKAVFAATAA